MITTTWFCFEGSPPFCKGLRRHVPFYLFFLIILWKIWKYLRVTSIFLIHSIFVIRTRNAYDSYNYEPPGLNSELVQSWEGQGSTSSCQPLLASEAGVGPLPRCAVSCSYFRFFRKYLRMNHCNACHKITASPILRTPAARHPIIFHVPL